MKHIFTPLLLLITLTVFGNTTERNNSNKTDKKAVSLVMSPAASTTLSLQQLQQENQLLRQQLEALTKEAEALENSSGFELTMTRLFAQLQDKSRHEQMEELQAQVQYLKTMQALFSRLASK